MTPTVYDFLEELCERLDLDYEGLEDSLIEEIVAFIDEFAQNYWPE